MNKKEIKMLRVQNAIKIVLLLIPFVIFSQQRITGKYHVDYLLKDFATLYDFTDNGLFNYNHHGDLGLEKYGKGHYYIKNDSLILNYDLTEPKLDSYHKMRRYTNSSDSIKIKVNVYNLKKNRISHINKPMVSWQEGALGYKMLNEGTAVLNFKKEKGKKKLSVGGLCCRGDKFSINTYYNYDIEVFLRESYENPDAIKNEIKKYKLLEKTDSVIKLDNGSNILKLVKQKE